MLLRIRPSFRAALAALLPAAAAGCLSSSTDVTGTSSAAGVRVVQGVSDAPNGVDLSINGAVTAPNIPLGAVLPSASYSPIAPGTTFGFAPNGGTTFYNRAPSLLVGVRYTIVAYGRTTANATPAAAVAVLTDTGTADAARARLRVFNALDYLPPAGGAAGTPVDVYIYAQGSARPSTPTASVAYGASSAYVPGGVGTLQIDVLAAGTASTGTPLFSTTVGTSAGVIGTLVLLDTPATTASSASGAVIVLNDGY